MKIVVAGIGYVGLSMAVLLSQHNEVVAYDISKDKVDMLNKRISPIVDKEISEFLSSNRLNLCAKTDVKADYKNADYVIVATPTNYDEEKQYFDTGCVEQVINDVLETGSEATIIIKSTLPMGYVIKAREKYNTDRIIFSPEFLREGRALYDNLYPSRIIVGDQSERAREFAWLLAEGARKEDIPVLFTDPTEAEAIKLFANTYLAMRVAYFNELDTYAAEKGLNSRQIIDGICLDPRIGMQYKNPSFGYGGYCFPKDTKQLKANFDDVPNNIVDAIVDSNYTRMKYIAASVMKRNPKVVGVYRLTMKKSSDNFRKSAVFGVMEVLQEAGIKIVIFEPVLTEDKYMGYDVINSFDEFATESDVIIANRISSELEDVWEKVYTRDIYECD